VCQAGVQSLQALVDDVVGDLGVAEFCGAVEELGDQQVLPLGVSSTKPYGVGLGRPARCISDSA
jgi:hypothetical protein